MDHAETELYKHETEPSASAPSLEAAALRTALQHAEAALAAKDRELAAKQEIIALLREKIHELERVPRDDFDFLSPRSGLDARVQRSPPPRPSVKRDAEEAPKSAWARFYKWFREA